MRRYLYLTAAVGVTGVIAGAFGAHALKGPLTAQGTLSTWNTAVLYHLIHAPALLATGLFAIEKNLATSWCKRAFVCWITGIVLFSGSLYWLSLGGPRLLGPVTPLGGVFLILGWLCVAGAASQLTPKSTK